MPADQTTVPVRLVAGQSWTRWALLASLAVNALFVGGFVSALVRYGVSPPGTAQGPAAQHNLAAYVATLPADRTSVIWRKAAGKRQALNQNRRLIRDARDEALLTLTAEPYDKERFLAAQTLLIEAEHTQRLAQRDFLADLAGSLTPDERRAFMRWRGAARPQAGDRAQPQPPTPELSKP